MGKIKVNAQVTIIEPETLEYLPAKTLLRLVEQSQKTAKHAKEFRQTVGALPELFRTFEEMDIEPCFDLDNPYICLAFTGDGKRLGEVWGLLRRHGYKTDTHPEKGSTEFYAFWDRPEVARLFMHFTSSMCRRVKVGTKMVEQDIYETQCGELPKIESDDKPVVVADVVDDIPF